MAQIDDVIKDIQKKLTWLNWRDETHFTMRIDEVTTMLKETLAVAQGEGPVTTMYDLGINATNCSVTCSVIVDDTETMVEQGFGVLPEGSTFYMVVEPDQDYALESISVNGNYYDITDDIMTIVVENVQDNIEVVATASEATPPEPADLTVGYENCTVVCTVNGETVSDGEGVLTIGQQLTVTVTPDQDYEVYELNINGVDYKDEMVDGSVTVTVDQNMVISVTCYDPSITYSISNISTDVNILSLTATNQMTGQDVDLTDIPFGTPLTLAIEVTSGYVVDTLEINEEDVSVTPQETVGNTYYYYGFVVGTTTTEALTEIKATAIQVFSLTRNYNEEEVIVNYTLDEEPFDPQFDEYNVASNCLPSGSTLKITAMYEPGYTGSILVNMQPYTEGNPITVNSNIQVDITVTQDNQE